MALLKKIKAATLMETMVATVLIVVIFMIASMLMNSVFSSSIKANTNAVTERMHELEYGYKNGSVTIPYYEEQDAWQLQMEKQQIGKIAYIRIEALHPKSQKTIVSYIISEE